MATARTADPLARASSAARPNNRARGWVNWRASSPGHCRPPRRLSSFGPSATSLRAASRVERPDADVRRLWKSMANGSRGSGNDSVGSIAAGELVPSVPVT